MFHRARISISWFNRSTGERRRLQKIYLNTISPQDLRDRVVPQFYRLRDEGRIAGDIRIAVECSCRPNSLRYNPQVSKEPRL